MPLHMHIYLLFCYLFLDCDLPATIIVQASNFQPWIEWLFLWLSFTLLGCEGLLRCGKSCRLRWVNYLRADLKRGDISVEEENTIVKLHASLGNRLVSRLNSTYFHHFLLKTTINSCKSCFHLFALGKLYLKQFT